MTVTHEGFGRRESGKHTDIPGMSFAQSTFALSSLNSSNEHPCILEISQHESPGCTQYPVLFLGHKLVGAFNPGERMRRQTRRRTTATMRKKGNKVRYALEFPFWYVAEPRVCGRVRIELGNDHGDSTNRVRRYDLISVWPQRCRFNIVLMVFISG